jgi:hypothetical protein
MEIIGLTLKMQAKGLFRRRDINYFPMFGFRHFTIEDCQVDADLFSVLLHVHPERETDHFDTIHQVHHGRNGGRTLNRLTQLSE